MEKEKGQLSVRYNGQGKTGCGVVLLCGCQICQVTAKWGGLTALEPSLMYSIQKKINK